LRKIAHHFTFRPVFVAIASLFVAHSAAFAADLTATGSYQVGTAPVVTSTQNNTYTADVFLINYANTPYAAAVHSFGTDYGLFGSRTSGYGTYDVKGSFGLVDTITNFTSAAQKVSFTFHISPGLIDNELRSGLTGNEFVSAGVNFNIQRNGTSVWGSSATLTSNASGTTFNQTGANLYTEQPGNSTYYRIDGLTQTIDLGVLNAGESLELRYDLSSFAKGRAPGGVETVVPEQTYVVPEHWVNFCGGGCNYGYGGDYGPQLVPSSTVTVPSYTYSAGTPSGSHAGTGDPFSFTLNGGNQPQFAGFAALPLGINNYEVGFTPIAAAVPEPTTTALMFLGLGVVGAAVQRRRRNNTV
jgi:hypothetical protein